MADEKLKVVYTGQANVFNGVANPQGKEFELTLAQIRAFGGPSSGHTFEAVRKSDVEKVAKTNTVAPVSNVEAEPKS